MAKRRPSKPAPVSAEDAALFRAAIGQVRELDAPPESPIAARPEPQARSREADDAAALKQMQRDPFAMALPGDAIEYLKPGLPPRVLRRLKRGHYKVQDEIDLHHMTTALAESALREFLHDCRREAHLCIRIVHGKGLGSGPQGPVLKGLVEQMLRRRADVLAYASAPVTQGGTGAALVLLAPRRMGESGPIRVP
jgi:DNA-nicking Smr family endonuclease